MKIKEVCEKTGLTDRAIRYYIENGLVFPDKNENYAGHRKTATHPKWRGYGRGVMGCEGDVF